MAASKKPSTAEDEEDWEFTSNKGFSFDDEEESRKSAIQFSKDNKSLLVSEELEYSDSILAKAEEKPTLQVAPAAVRATGSLHENPARIQSQSSAQQPQTTKGKGAEMRFSTLSGTESKEKTPSSVSQGTSDSSFPGVEGSKVPGSGISALKTHSRSPSVGAVKAVPEPLPIAPAAPLNYQPTIDDVVKAEKQSLSPWSDVAKLEAQILSLQKQLSVSRSGEIPANEVIRRIVHGQAYILEGYKSKESKIALLNEAIRTHDGNAITTIVLFMKKTLSTSAFHQIIMERPVALSHYHSYLRVTGALEELEDTLTMAGRVEEAAMLRYKLVISSKNPEIKMKKLKQCLTTHFSLESLSGDRAHIEAQISLLEMQLPVEKADSEAEVSGRNPLLKQLKRTRSLIDTSLVNTLHYCCLYHYDEPEGNLASPRRLRRQYEVAEKQYLWTVLAALAIFRRWTHIDDLLSTKNFFGKAQLKCAIGFDKLVDILSKTGVPAEVMDKYVRLVDAVEVRLASARKHGCHRAVVDTLVLLRDKAALEAYRDKMNTEIPEYRYATDVLGMPSIKWKT